MSDRADADLRPRPDADGAYAPHWAAAADGRVALPRCTACGRGLWPPRAVCPACGGSAFDWETVHGEGVVDSYVVSRRAFHPGFAADVPYVVGAVRLTEGRRMLGQLFGVEPESVRVGLAVRARFVRRDGVTLVCWEPANGQPG